MFKIIHLLMVVTLASAGGASVALNNSDTMPVENFEADIEADQTINFDSDFLKATNNFQGDSSVEINNDQTDEDQRGDKTEINSDYENNVDNQVKLSEDVQSQNEANLESSINTNADSEVESSNSLNLKLEIH